MSITSTALVRTVRDAVASAEKGTAKIVAAVIDFIPDHVAWESTPEAKRTRREVLDPVKDRLTEAEAKTLSNRVSEIAFLVGQGMTLAEIVALGTTFRAVLAEIRKVAKGLAPADDNDKIIKPEADPQPEEDPLSVGAYVADRILKALSGLMQVSDTDRFDALAIIAETVETVTATRRKGLQTAARKIVEAVGIPTLEVLVNA